jgi:hypothetical protein
MSAAKSNTAPVPCWRARIGQPTTLGEFRRMTECFSDDAPLAVRNGPLPTLYYLGVDGWGHIEIEIPDIHANTVVRGGGEADVPLHQIVGAKTQLGGKAK